MYKAMLILRGVSRYSIIVSGFFCPVHHCLLHLSPLVNIPRNIPPITLIFKELLTR